MQPGLQIVVRGQLVQLPAFLVQPHPPAMALRIKVFHPHRHRRADPGKAVDEQSDEGAVAQAHHAFRVDRLQQLPCLRPVQHRGLAALHHIARAFDGRGRIDRDHLAGDQPVEQHADRREAEFHGRGRVGFAQGFDVGRHMERLHLAQVGEPARRHEATELPRRPRVSGAGVRVADRDREELPEALLRPGARRDDQRRGLAKIGQAGVRSCERDQLVHPPSFLQKVSAM